MLVELKSCLTQEEVKAAHADFTTEDVLSLQLTEEPEKPGLIF